jgi:hypothetical protein
LLTWYDRWHDKVTDDLREDDWFGLSLALDSSRAHPFFFGLTNLVRIGLELDSVAHFCSQLNLIRSD